MSATSFFAPAGSVFDFSRQTGTRAAVTATVERSVASRSAVLLVDQPPQLKPTIIVTMLPITKPHAPGLNMVIIGLSFVLVGPMKPRQGLATILDQGPMGPSQSFTIR